MTSSDSPEDVAATIVRECSGIAYMNASPIADRLRDSIAAALRDARASAEQEMRAPVSDEDLRHIIDCLRWAGDRLEYEEFARAEEAVQVLADLAAKSPRMEQAIDLALRLLCDVTPERLDVVRDVLRIARGKS